MKKHRLILVAGAIAAALAAPQISAQYRTDGYDSTRTTTESRTGWTWWDNFRNSWRNAWRGDSRVERGAWIQTDPDLYDGGRTWYWHPRAHIGPDNAYHSPTDGMNGGAGIPAPNGVVPSTSPLVASGEPPYPSSRLSAQYYRDYRAAGPLRSTDPQVNPQRSPTDGRSGGTNVPSTTSGAVPSTQPAEDAGAAARAPSPTTVR